MLLCVVVLLCVVRVCLFSKIILLLLCVYIYSSRLFAISSKSFAAFEKYGRFGGKD